MKSQTLPWPLHALPRLHPDRAGTFPMLVPGCNRAYEHDTLALHLHDYRGTLRIGRRNFQLERGDITLSPGGVVSRYALEESGSHLCLHFSAPATSATGTAIHLPLHLRLGPQTAAARERFWRIIDYVRLSGGPAGSTAAAAASCALQELLLWLHLQSRRGPAPRRSSRLEQALKKLAAAIEASLARPMLVEELAAGVGLSPDYVTRHFARRYGMRLQHHLLLRRIELARHFLLSSDLRISEIGRRVGLPDPQYFNKQFRRVAGVSPLAYRRARAGRKQEPRPLRASVAKKPRPSRRDKPRANRSRPSASGKRRRIRAAK